MNKHTHKNKDKLTKWLLMAGIAGGLLVMVVSFTLAFTEPGFDITKHANSQLVLGQRGWLQTLNFILFGVLLIAFAVGIRRTLRGKPGSLWAPILVGIYGLFAAIIVGFNPTDPMFGFPPGSPLEYPGYESVSLSAKIHGIAGVIGFSAMTIACFVFARYFAWAKDYTWTALSLAVGGAVGAVVVYLATASNTEVSSFNYIPVWAAGAVLWLFVSLIAARLLFGKR